MALDPSLAQVLKLNQFQRFIRRIRDFPRYMGQFRRRHPYGFSFIAAAVATIPVLAALGVMIAFPPATPAVLGGAAAFAAHLGLATFIPAFAAVSVLASAVVGGIAAGVRRGFAGISRLFRKPLLVSESDMSVSSEVLKQRITVLNNQSNATLVQLPVTLPSVSSSAVVAQTLAAHAAELASELIEAPLPELPAVPSVIAIDVSSAKDHYLEASKQYQDTRNQIVRHFNQMIKLVESITATDFHSNNAKSRTKDSLVKMKNEFCGGASVASLLETKWNAYWGSLDRSQFELVQAEFTSIKALMESEAYRKYEGAERKLNSIGDDVYAKQRDARANYSTPGTQLYGNKSLYEAENRAILEEKKEKKTVVISQFKPS